MLEMGVHSVMASVSCLSLTRLQRLFLIVFCIAPVLAAIGQALPIFSRLVSVLDQRLPRVASQDLGQIDGIISLGGDFDRAVEAIEQAQRFPTARLIIAGGARSGLTLMQELRA